MSTKLPQLAAKRRTSRITRKAVQERLGCSYSWTRWLETGAYDGPTVGEWRARYKAALDELIEERKARTK
jgi:hypothetical protein